MYIDQLGGACTDPVYSEHLKLVINIQSSHRQIYTGSIDMGISQILSSIRRCKDWFCDIKMSFLKWGFTLNMYTEGG